MRKRKIAAWFPANLAAGACSLGILTPRAPAVAYQSVPAVRSVHGMVSSSDAIATKVGVKLLKRGGNAVDAAVGVGLALAVTYPEAGNIGGGGFMMIRLASGKSIAIDYRETAPRAARRAAYLDKHGRVIPQASSVGYRAVGVPGTVAGLYLAQRRYGRLRWRDVVEPARRLAARGFVVPRSLATDLRQGDPLKHFSESRRIFMRSGRYYGVRDKFRQPELARTLSRIQKYGARDFYHGRTARLIAADMRAHHGLIGAADLAAYRPIIREPIVGTYRDCQLVTMPPPSSGGIALLESLNILENFNLGRASSTSTRRSELLIETMARVFIDRARYAGDPGFVAVPTQRLISKKYARGLAQDIQQTLGRPFGHLRHGNTTGNEGHQTTNFAVVDAAGNAVDNTYTLNNYFGSGVTIHGAGFLLNDEMDDFAFGPVGSPGTGEIRNNVVQPHKRPISSMAPTILLKNGRLLGVLGCPGGPTIISSLVQVLVNMSDLNMDLSSAIAAPRLHEQWQPAAVRFETQGFPNGVLQDLRKIGYEMVPDNDDFGDVTAVMVDARTHERIGATDSRQPNALATGY
jgi:gamma-glutamyltranspeptidase/glutathione hydrolase